MPQWKLDHASYVVTGAPVVVNDLTHVLAGSTLRLLLIGVVVMALVLALAFRGRLRLLPLLVALGAIAITFGLVALVGAPLTMAGIAVLPGAARASASTTRSSTRRGATRTAAPPRWGRSPPRRWRPAPASSCCCSRRCRWSRASGCC